MLREIENNGAKKQSIRRNGEKKSEMAADANNRAYIYALNASCRMAKEKRAEASGADPAAWRLLAAVWGGEPGAI